jgi:DNA repair protein RecN (Recombination protein N)
MGKSKIQNRQSKIDARMLRELHISNLAVISDARIEFHRGLNCFTGTTGAGKSLVIGAIELLLGLRSAAEMLRPGAEEGRVSGLFEIRDANLLREIESATDVPVSQDDGEILITRRLHASGRTSVSLNGNPITLNMLKQVSEALVDVHGQHDHQYLLKPANQIDVLDEFAELWPLRQKYAEVYSQLQETERRLSELSANRTLREQQLELYRFQANEIDSGELDPGEFDELRARSSVLENLEKLKKDVGASHGALYETDGSILERLKMMAAVLSELSELDQNLKPIATTVRDATLQLEDAAFDMGRYLDKLDLDPSELAEVTDRLNTINRLVNKYGDPVSVTLAYRQQIARQIAELERATDDLDALQKDLEPLKRELSKLGEELTRARRASAAKLSPLIESQLAELGMEKARFSVAMTSSTAERGTSGALASGFDQVEFIVQTNPGLTAQPLRKIASGGELSRIMLALKGILAQGDRVSVLVFDEIDANVGGRLGSIIGSKLRHLAEHHQVLCITHLPQIASYADRHLTVRKQSDGNQTRTTVRAIAGDEQLEELSEMIGGQRITATTRAQARELLEGARSHASPAKTASRAAKPTVAKARSRKMA